MFNNFNLTNNEIQKIINDYENLIKKYSEINHQYDEDLSQEIKLFIFRNLSKNRKK